MDNGMKISPDFKELIDAIHKVQQNVGVIKRTETADIGKYKYSYANIASIWERLKPLLEVNGLTILQPPIYDMVDKLQTWVFHTSGQWLYTTSRLVSTKDDPQAFGSAITYAKRYTICSILGIITDDDNDAKDHRLATAQQKQRLIGAVKQIYPELEKPADIITTLQNITGKYPGNIREDEAEDAINLVKAFASKGEQLDE